MLREQEHIAPDGAWHFPLQNRSINMTRLRRYTQSENPVRGGMFIETNRTNEREAPEERHVKKANYDKISLEIALA